MHSRLLILVVVALLPAACIGTRTQTWQSPQFAETRAGWLYYRWGSLPLGIEGQQPDTMLAVDQALREQVDSALVARGYVQHQEKAQFELDYRIGDTASAGQAGPSWPLSPREEYQRIMAGPNAEYEISSRFYTHQTLGYHEVNSIKLTAYDIASRRIVWESTATKLVDDPGASPEKVGEIVAASARKIIKNFPGVAAERN